MKKSIFEVLYEFIFFSDKQNDKSGNKIVIMQTIHGKQMFICVFSLDSANISQILQVLLNMKFFPLGKDFFNSYNQMFFI